MNELEQQIVANMYFFNFHYAVSMMTSIAELNRIAQECPDTNQEVVAFLEQLNKTVKTVWLQRIEKELNGDDNV